MSKTNQLLKRDMHSQAFVNLDSQHVKGYHSSKCGKPMAVAKSVTIAHYRLHVADATRSITRM